MCINCGFTIGCAPNCVTPARPKTDAVNHPQHYGGDEPYEVIKVMIAWDAEMAYHFCVGNAIKYFGRLGKKDPEKRVEDLRKAGWYASKAAEIYEEHLSEDSDVRR